MLQPATEGTGALTPDRIVQDRSVLLDRTDGQDRHIVLAAAQGPLRLHIKNHTSGQGLACVIPTDSMFELRIAAVRWFHAVIGGKAAQARPPGLFPTPYQRSRLGLMLRALDHLSANPASPAPIREVAATVLYPHSQFANAAEWKSSSERRRTQRLIEEAQMLVNGGYRALLLGQMR